MSMIAQFNDKDFKEKTAQGVVLVDFFASWCGPCKMLAKVLEQVAEEIEGKGIICKVDIEEAPETAAEFNVQSVPALFIMKNGEIVKSFTGVQSKKILVDALLDV